MTRGGNTINDLVCGVMHIAGEREIGRIGGGSRAIGIGDKGH